MIYNTEIIDFIIKQNLLGFNVLKESPFYKLNQNLRRANVKFNLTPDEEEQLKKVQETGILPVKIRDMENGNWCDLVLMDFQKELLKNMDDERFMFVNHSRQMGMSLCISYHLVKKYGMVNSEKDNGIVLVSLKGSEINQQIRKIKDFYEQLPFFMKAGIKKWNDGSIEFDNGNRIVGMNSKDYPAVGFGIDSLIMYDCKNIGDRFEKRFYNNIIPTICARTNSQIFIFENGQLDKDSFHGKLFYEHNNYNKYQYHYRIIPGRDFKWVEEQWKIYGRYVFRKENDIDFYETK
jgi:hypothetical protein